MTERLDPGHYRPVLIQNDALLRRFGALDLAELYLRSGIGHTAAVTPHYTSAEDGVAFVSGGCIVDGHLHLAGATRIQHSAHVGIMSGSRLAPGWVLFVRKGELGNSAIVPPGREVNCSSEVMFLEMRPDADAGFVSSYFNSRHGRMAFLRQQRGMMITSISLYDVPNLPVPKVHRDVARYIGDKVRQAERLRERARRLRRATSGAFSAAGLLPASSTIKRVERVRAVDVLDRLDSLHYRSDLLENLHAIRRHPTVCLGSATDFAELADGDHGNPVYGDGPIYVRATELAGDTLDSHTEARLDERYSNALPSSVWASSNDVLFSIVGTLGAVGILEDGNRAVLSRGVAKVRPIKLQKHYVKAFMRTRTFANELLRRSVGTIQRGVYLESLRGLEIPVLDEHIRSVIANNEETADKSLLYSKRLSRAACLIVEHLIEGRISESDLVAAQKALEAGDYSADRSILQALRQSDAPMARPLIPDLDGLYALLDEPDEGEDR
ncbi:restriction endonuclease subunit S domain-containing protein [Paraburkholderia bannensis]|uniref:hypothetical protein n=1 Tax=Paraburkholderia bannensis TaxID=765414 RepID=UPI002ABE9DDB|nr:hypothetical protein [Paraburkholderia bannensis]